MEGYQRLSSGNKSVYIGFGIVGCDIGSAHVGAPNVF